MSERFFSILGRGISNSVRGAAHSGEFRDLKQEVKETFRDVIEGGNFRRQSRRNRCRPPRSPISPDPSVQTEARSLRYPDSRSPWKQVSSILPLIFGGIFGVVSASLLIALIVAAATLSAADILLILASVTVPFSGFSAWMIAQGCRIRGRLNRIARYLNGAGAVDFCSVDQPAGLVRKPPTSVMKNLEKMIRSNVLPDGYSDDQKTCLILGEETCQQYLQVQQSMKERERRSAQKGEPEGSTTPSKGRDLLNQISQAKNFITDGVALLKIPHLESITERILNYVEEHPEEESQIRKFSEHYLPTTLKLTYSYCHFGNQLVQGENIISAKKQIRGSLGTINTAFGNLLDSLFGDATMNILSGISAPEVMLTREGLTGDDFKGSDDIK